eukprot:scaffold212997_cov37-Cyclotella_meneghiniana.AAC.1
MKAIIKGKRIGGHGSSRRHRILPLFLAAAACCCTYYIANLRQLASTAAQLPYYAVQPSFLGMAVPQGRAVALPSVRISAEESEKIQRKIYGGEGDYTLIIQNLFFKRQGAPRRLHILRSHGCITHPVETHGGMAGREEPPR